MNYEFYRLIHFITLIIVTASLGVSYFGNPPKKWAKYLGMSASLLLMIAGMGLLAKTMPGQPWPLWAKMKIGIWAIIALAGPIMAKRLTVYRGVAFSSLLILFTIAITLAVYKPSFS